MRKTHGISFTKAVGGGILVLGFVASAAQAGKKYPTQSSGGGYMRNSNSSSSSSPPPRPVNTAEINAAQKKVDAAQAELSKAQTAFYRLDMQLRLEAQKKPDYVAAALELKNAESANAAAHEALETSLVSDPAYTAALAAEDKAQAQVTSLRESEAPAETISTAAKDQLAFSSAVSKIRGEREQNDPELAKARARLVAASQTIDGLNTANSEARKANPEWQKARKAVDECQVKFSAAEGELTKALGR